jgi:hypothetical protein
MEPTQGKKKSTLPPIVMVGIGCLVLLILLGIGSTLALHFFARKVGTSLLQSAIESKTGVKTNLQDIQNGKMSFTDTKTGETVDIGTGKLPDNFPVDFPQYPGAKVEGSLTGSQTGSSNGFWVTFSTPDAMDKVVAFYKTGFKNNGWNITGTMDVGSVTTYTVEKGSLEGTVAISADTDKKETGIVVTLGNNSSSSDTTNQDEMTP